jgi:hypothetical protein
MPLLYAALGGAFVAIVMMHHVEHWRWLAKFNGDRADFWRKFSESESRK